MFSGLMINKEGNVSLTEIAECDLPDGDVTVDIDYSSINYKDALAITGRGPIIKQFPMVPGIDLAGTVAESACPQFKVGDKVFLTGWGVGEKHWGGLAEKARVSSEWLTQIPENTNSKHVMAIGTAGLTAMLCVEALLKRGVRPEDGPVLVTGASGGVGSCASLLLSSMGYKVTASTGRSADTVWLYDTLGVSDIIHRNELASPGKPLQKAQWIAAIDTVGSHTLCNVCARMHYGGIVAACGMVQGIDMPGSVAPFILRGVTLQGIDSVMLPKNKRSAVWENAIHHLPQITLDSMTKIYPLKQAMRAAEELLNGNVRARAVIQCR